MNGALTNSRDEQHDTWMGRALAIAAAMPNRTALPNGAAVPDGAGGRDDADDPEGAADVPVGAVVYGPDGTELATGRNLREYTGDPTAHAEIVALRGAATALGAWRLDGCTLVVTTEPCTMCAGALVQARIATLVFGAWEPKTGAVGSLWDVVRDRRLTHRPQVYAGVRQEACAALLRDFFADRRPPTTGDRRPTTDNPRPALSPQPVRVGRNRQR